jgi:hypothetical protein
MKRLSTLAIIVMLSGASYAQNEFVRGYIISTNGDTLKGEIHYHKKDIENYNHIMFKDATGAQKSYKPDRISGYGADGKHFVSGMYKDEATFYRAYSAGMILTLEIVIETIVANNIAYVSEYYLLKQGDKDYTRINEKKTKKQLKEIMKDNTEFADKYEEGEKFDIVNVAKVVRQYDNWARSK